MRLLIQRVNSASVTVNEATEAEIGEGLLVFVAAGEGDGREDFDYCVDKTLNLRIFADEEGQMDLSVKDVGGEILVVPQFTLYGDVTKGRRPSFFEAMDPGPAERMYDEFVETLEESGLRRVESGVFGAHMDVELVNDGPVTIWVDSSEG